MKEYLELEDNEFRFSSIIGKSDTDFPIFYNHFKNREKLSFLNLGCQVPLIQFVAYHVFNFDTFIAIDTDSEYSCVKNFVERNTKSWEIEKQKEAFLWRNFFDVYTNLISPDATAKPKITTKIEFDNIFLKDFQNIDIRNYLSNETRKFDLIDASNILHFFSNKRELKNIISKISNLLKKDGVLHISVNTNHPFDIPFFRKLIKNSVKEGYFIICKKDNCTETHFLNVAYK